MDELKDKLTKLDNEVNKTKLKIIGEFRTLTLRERSTQDFGEQLLQWIYDGNSVLQIDIQALRN